MNFLRNLGRKLWARAPAEAEAPRRIKRYAAQTGYVYEYVVHPGQDGVYSFDLSWNRKEWRTITVEVPQTTVDGWQVSRQRELKRQQRYAVAKLAMFAMLDESVPADLASRLTVDAATLEAILASLDV